MRSLLIAKAKKAFTIAEDLFLPAAFVLAETMLDTNLIQHTSCHLLDFLFSLSTSVRRLVTDTRMLACISLILTLLVISGKSFLWFLLFCGKVALFKTVTPPGIKTKKYNTFKRKFHVSGISHYIFRMCRSIKNFKSKPFRPYPQEVNLWLRVL